MALIDGDNFVLGNIGSYQEWNRIKNNWRGSAAPTNPQPGMLFSDDDNDKLWHCIDTSQVWDEVLQETMSFDARPIFDNIYLDIDGSDVSNPPTEAELDAIFPGVGDGFIGLVQDSTTAGALWLAVKSGAAWWILEFSAAGS